MVFCRGCAKQLHETALTCPQCGAPPQLTSALPAQTTSGESPWTAVTSLIFSILSILPLVGEGPWDQETMLGLSAFALTGLILGIVSINQKKTGNSMGVAGIVISTVSLISLITLSITHL
ncbi:DUF4190 domain-containing protein [Pseudomonas entomophila]|uniref:DUF4190 domain-containing protein n=1 Tax=Pseudomonas entomophila TaxID=312306 RepID=UPI0023D8665E|nr:DUF4190 domain-containing protein [Pseudomonas entomophila]MDF0734187.1 DUF4190 domain-containing protein [Pseudomonas entomophila]